MSSHRSQIRKWDIKGVKMKLIFSIKAAIIPALGAALCLGASGFANAQKKDDANRQSASRNNEAHDRRQQIYHQQQSYNQQRFDQRSKNSGHMVEKGNEPANGSITAYRDQIGQRPAADGEKNPPEHLFSTRQADQIEGKQILAQQQTWRRSQKAWQNGYNLQWDADRARYKGESKLLKDQHRPEQLAFQNAYWERVKEDRGRLRDWRFVNDVVLNYSYARDGRFFYTSEFGMNMLVDALNDGYQEGFLAGESDRDDRWSGGYENELAYLDASYGYNGYWVGLGEYQYYFRLGFRRGYDDALGGMANPYRSGDARITRYSMTDGSLNGIIDFSIVAR